MVLSREMTIDSQGWRYALCSPNAHPSRRIGYLISRQIYASTNFARYLDEANKWECTQEDIILLWARSTISTINTKFIFFLSSDAQQRKYFHSSLEKYTLITDLREVHHHTQKVLRRRTHSLYKNVTKTLSRSKLGRLYVANRILLFFFNSSFLKKVSL